MYSEKNLSFLLLLSKPWLDPWIGQSINEFEIWNCRIYEPNLQMWLKRSSTIFQRKIPQTILSQSWQSCTLEQSNYCSRHFVFLNSLCTFLNCSAASTSGILAEQIVPAFCDIDWKIFKCQCLEREEKWRHYFLSHSHST